MEELLGHQDGKEKEREAVVWMPPRSHEPRPDLRGGPGPEFPKCLAAFSVSIHMDFLLLLDVLQSRRDRVKCVRCATPPAAVRLQTHSGAAGRGRVGHSHQRGRPARRYAVLTARSRPLPSPSAAAKAPGGAAHALAAAAHSQPAQCLDSSEGGASHAAATAAGAAAARSGRA